MKKPDRPKTNELGWVFAFLFPKKAKPAPKPVSDPVSVPPPQASPVYATSSPPASATRAPDPSPTPSFVTKPQDPSPSAKPAAEAKPKKPILQPAKLLPAFWTVASGLSFIVNIILIVTLIILGQELFSLKKLVGDNLIGGLYENFILMDQAHIKSNIKVDNQIPINFDLKISQDTVVTLTEPTRINGATVVLNSGGLSINSPANITLPPGTTLPVHLEMIVPVSSTIPINLNVPVDIPLQETDLHKPFIGLQGVLSPYYWMLQPGIKNTTNIEACNNLLINWFCDSFFVK